MASARLAVEWRLASHLGFPRWQRVSALVPESPWFKSHPGCVTSPLSIVRARPLPLPQKGPCGLQHRSSASGRSEGEAWHGGPRRCEEAPQEGSSPHLSPPRQWLPTLLPIRSTWGDFLELSDASEPSPEVQIHLVRWGPPNLYF